MVSACAMNCATKDNTDDIYLEGGNGIIYSEIEEVKVFVSL